jgi:hypothetical protein
VQGAERAAATIGPFLSLPERLAPVGLAQLCDSLKEIGRENQTHAIAVWETLLQRFRDPSCYSTLPTRARLLNLGGLWFVRGVFESYRDGNGALVAAAELDALGLKLYRMIASALRALHHANRGELDQALRHRDQVDMHAIQIGSAWQVEMWEPAAMTLVYTMMGDVVELRRVGDRLRLLARTCPSLERYARFAELALVLAREDDVAGERDPGATQALDERMAETLALIEHEPPRSFVGWGALIGNAARGLNTLARHVEAKALCEGALGHLVPADRAFVALFLGIEIELALADAGLGDIASARRRMDELLVTHSKSSNPLTRGRIHAGYARVAARAEDWTTFQHHFEQTSAWYRGTGTRALIAQLTRLRALDPKHSEPPTTAGPSTRRVRVRTEGSKPPPEGS